MKAPRFRYLRAEGVAQALDGLQADDAKVLAGGQSLVPLMNLRLARPEVLVDINPLAELARSFDDASSVLLGGLLRHRDLERSPLIARRNPLLAAAASHIGHLGIRNRGTLGGTLCHADPASEIPLVACVMDATIRVESARRGKRDVAARDFATGFFSTSAQPDELLTWVRIPALRPGEGWGFVEFARRHGDFAMAGAAATVQLDHDGSIKNVRAGAMAVSATPWLPPTGELVGRRPTDDVLGGWAEAVTAALRPPQDGAYRRRLTSVALQRAMRQAADRCALEMQEGSG